ncbi:hypothetical protein H6G93_19765 [Nostoc sp. FACHB-973]|nr:hypothetical protein [Nostoc sp. FACHB-973]
MANEELGVILLVTLSPSSPSSPSSPPTPHSPLPNPLTLQVVLWLL